MVIMSVSEVMCDKGNVDKISSYILPKKENNVN
jgi:hypothetical protein